MKTILRVSTILFLTLFSHYLHAQDPSAILDLETTTDGILIPRMTEGQRDNIANKVEGLMIFQTTDPTGFYYYTGSLWKKIGQDSWIVNQDTLYSSPDSLVTIKGKNVGIGIKNPTHRLEVIGDSGESLKPIAYFENTCDTVDGQLVDAYGVQGICANEDWAGFGGRFKGGFVGVMGEVYPTSNKNYYGTFSRVDGGSGDNFGVYGIAEGDGYNRGVRARAHGSNVNNAVAAYASGGVANYAIYARVDTVGVPGTYAGLFDGDVLITGSVIMGLDTFPSSLTVVGNIRTDSLVIQTNVTEGHVLTSDAVGNASWQAPSGTGMVPIGAIIPWNKNMPNIPVLPAAFIECDGSPITDTESPLWGQNTPDLNTAQRFLRGAMTSGSIGGSDTHSHSGSVDPGNQQVNITAAVSGPTQAAAQVNHAHTYTTSTTSNLPTFYEVVWIMRIK